MARSTNRPYKVALVYAPEPEDKFLVRRHTPEDTAHSTILRSWYQVHEGILYVTLYLVPYISIQYQVPRGTGTCTVLLVHVPYKYSVVPTYRYRYQPLT